MWNRFTEAARLAVYKAEAEARAQGQGFVDTEHLLLGVLTQEGCFALEVLEALRVRPKDLERQIRGQLSKGKTSPDEKLHLTQRGKYSIDLAYHEAMELQDNFIGTEHLLLGLIREQDSLAGRALARAGISLEEVRRAVPNIRDFGRSTAAFNPAGRVPETYTWEHYEPSAQQAMFEANDHAQSASQTGPAPMHLTHLLHALMGRLDPKLKVVLENHGIAPVSVQARIVQRKSWGTGGPDLYHTEIGKRATDAAEHEARLLDSPTVGVRHLLLGLIQADSANGGAFFEEHGLTVSKLRAALLKV